MTVALRPVTRENWRAVAHLQVTEEQRAFVAPNAYSLAEASYEEGMTAVAVYADEVLVGFALYTHEPFRGEWTFTREPYRGELGIVRMMIDRRFQRRGYGRQAMVALMAMMAQRPHTAGIILNFMPANLAARRLYESLGFEVYEENEQGCWARLPGDRAHPADLDGGSAG